MRDSAGYDTVEIGIPFKADYVGVVRLAASGVANRVGLDIEVIEDIKVAVAEVCNKLVSAGSGTADSFKIQFCIFREKLMILFKCNDESLRSIFNPESEELGLSIIMTLMDEVRMCNNPDEILSMTKYLGGESNV